MRIRKAMKQISRLQGEVSALKKRIDNSLNTDEANECFNENYKDLADSMKNKIKKMMTLKTCVMHANVKHNMFQKVLQLGELKSHIDFTRELDPKNGVIMSRYDPSEKTKFKSQLTVAQKNADIVMVQDLINSITDELDDFNATTDIEKMDGVTFLLD